MIRRSRDFQIFNISFLDIISCGFGAVVLLVLISKSGITKDTNSSDVSELLQNVFQYEAAISELSSLLKDQETLFEKTRKNFKTARSDQKKSSEELLRKSNELKKLEDDTRGLELVQSSLKTAAISKSTTKKRDVEVGGIVVDSDYVVFIIDTSGSMLGIWNRVIQTIGNVLDIHPTVKGFQILNDNGVYLLEAYRRRWIPDTPRRRKKVLEALTAWRSASNSSPVEGLEVALKTYAKPNIKVAIYIFGDDYTGSSFDVVIKKVELLNRNRVTGEPIVKIHGVGFISRHATNRFPILMREVARRNGGTFLGLP